jgi:ribosomal protein S6--L-glutamate ligase
VIEQETLVPEQLLKQRRPDLVLLKTATTLALSVAVADETAGVPFLNRASATLRAHDKAATIARLAAAGLPVPPTYLAAIGSSGPALPKADGGWVTKPTYGVHGRGVRVHAAFPTALPPTTEAGADGDASASFVVDDGTGLIQRRIGADEPDLKVYSADGRCFAGAKSFGTGSYARDSIDPVELDPRLGEVVRSVGAALALRCFGVDVRLDGGRPFVVDANPFPGYRGFPAAVPALRAEIERALDAGRLCAARRDLMVT